MDNLLLFLNLIKNNLFLNVIIFIYDIQLNKF